MIFHCRTILCFRADFSNIFTILDVRLIFFLSSTMNWNLKVRIQARDRQYSFCLLILGTRVTRILTRLIWMCHVVHNTCKMHGKDINTRYIGTTSILWFGKDWHSIRLDRMQSSFKEHFQLVVFQKLSNWRLKKSKTKSIHVTSTSTKDLITSRMDTNWVRKLFNNQKGKLFDNKKEKLFDKQTSSN